MIQLPPLSTLFPYTTLFRSTLIVVSLVTVKVSDLVLDSRIGAVDRSLGFLFGAGRGFLICVIGWVFLRSEEHTSELQSRENLVCRLLLEKKKNQKHPYFLSH